MEVLMPGDLHINFQIGAHSHEVDFRAQEKSGAKNSVLIGGVSYTLKGDKEAIRFVKDCLKQLPPDSSNTLEQTGRELKARLWVAGAKDITISSEETHKVGLKVLAGVDSLDLHKTIDGICDSLDKFYVFPEVAKKCSDYLRSQLREGAYHSISDPETLAQAITADIRLISEDKHIFIDFNQPAQKSEIELEEVAPEEQIKERYPTPSLTDTYTYKSASNIGWMGGNQNSFPHEIRSGLMEHNPKVGYVDLRIFGVCREKEPDQEIAKTEGRIKSLEEQRDHFRSKGSIGTAKAWSLDQEINGLKKKLEALKLADEWDLQQDVAARRKAIVEAVQNVKGAESVVIDLRNNGGGDPAAVQLMCSLFMDENRPLNRIEWRKGDAFESEDFNTLTDKELAADQRLLDQRVIILISPNTFSAAEEFTNNMKVLERATVVGEPSGGGANPGGPHQIGSEFTIFIPEGRAINPIQKGNWEGVGIIPDHVVPAQDALKEALLLT